MPRRLCPALACFVLSLTASACGGNDLETGDASRCITDNQAGTVECDYESYTVNTGVGNLNPRNVIYQVPVGTPPADGWPVVILFHGSFHPAFMSFSGSDGMRFGGHFQAESVRDLLDTGYAVLAPDAHLGGALYWDSNLWLYSGGDWDWAEDRYFMDDFFDAIDGDDAFGPLNSERMFAMGISSGGFMTSRMATTEADRFDAVAIISGSYATCYWKICDVPELDRDHPPTLFLHGANDATVPVETMDVYVDALEDADIEYRRVVEEDAGHGYISTSAVEIVRWFETH